VDEQHVLIGSGERGEEVGFLGDTGFEQVVVNTSIFFRRKDMLADRKKVTRRIDEGEGKHGRAFA
jgi:hypothetical protein